MDFSIPPYVIDLINKIAKDEKFENHSISTESGSDIDGFQSLIFKITITGLRNNHEDKLCLICKIPSLNIARRKQFHSDITFDCELFFYENVFPYFETFQRERGVHSDDGFFAFPKCYGLIRDEKSLGDHAIVMDNLNEKCYYMLDKANDIDFDHSILVLKELGKLHAVSFAIRDQEPEKFKQFMERTSLFHYEVNNSTGAKFLQKAHYDRAIRSLDPSELDLIRKMESLKLTYVDLINQVKTTTTCEPFGVLIHGDCWINNLLYRGSSKPSNVCLIDWQLSQFGSPAIDVACFLFCSLSPQLRNEHFDQFMNIYYGTLESTLRKLGSDPTKLFTFDNLRDQMRQFSKYVMYLAPIMIGIMTSDMTKVPSFDEVTRRMDLLTNDPTADVTLDDAFEENDAYKHRMSNLIRDMDRLGYW
ncbi:uncharacterized protein LOC119085771 [Bradysia coprophila]|uniref:uncharacterized protein LOC119085771 n=1 Tax=Bradysia coprophila TaxID=38358 RepID=UPI00187DB12D|nr:uncharacterized protein LOC119085771 [Bradysia coprophila]